ncbi:MAG: hypothetical protein MH321_11440 [Leptospiraceae bacterium]|nr:hypothetical protein [Leptospiraceae bacterium]
MKGNNFKNIWERSSIFPSNSGVPYKIWVTTKQRGRKYIPRVKVEIEGIFYTLIILSNGNLKWKEPPGLGKDIEKIITFVEVNKDAILNHYKGKTSSVSFANKIIKI